MSKKKVKVMENINDIEKDLLYSIKCFADTYKNYQDSFSDEKMEDIKNGVIVPISNLGKNLLETFDELAPLLNDAKERNIISDD